MIGYNDDEVSTICEGCGEAILIDDHYYVVCGVTYCEPCIRGCRKLATETMKEKFAILEREVI